jgi:RNA polymerase sigma-70 factor (ECF subfamily)
LSNIKDISVILVERLRQRDLTAIDYLYDYYGSALFGIIRKIIPNDMMAEETMHDVLLKIWNQIDHYEESKGRFFTWIYRIARNQALDKRRSRDFLSAEKSNDITDYVDSIEDGEEQSDPGLLQAVKDLGKKCYDLIQLNFFMGYSHKEIAENEDIPLGTVKTRIRKCLNDLKISLGQDFG